MFSGFFRYLKFKSLFVVRAKPFTTKIKFTHITILFLCCAAMAEGEGSGERPHVTETDPEWKWYILAAWLPRRFNDCWWLMYSSRGWGESGKRHRCSKASFSKSADFSSDGKTFSRTRMCQRRFHFTSVCQWLRNIPCEKFSDFTIYCILMNELIEYHGNQNNYATRRQLRRQSSLKDTKILLHYKKALAVNWKKLFPILSQMGGAKLTNTLTMDRKILSLTNTNKIFFFLFFPSSISLAPRFSRLWKFFGSFSLPFQNYSNRWNVYVSPINLLSWDFISLWTRVKSNCQSDEN